ncbi:inositol monophosphatase family protein [Krasilnikoviella flava]|uniref:3'(2'),5'-bisphosphate nucleotidase n=1 Tax=Krasilnikoviella flava TaxID=526729 RepID=A0A1T5I9Q2_9MICO|nr:inositol monophosphatase family protein [Krasilnikoviella flava]SKC35916.1 3'(2'),5'-bisphosphate nucleotidase [Krasilnikoviella flava]
MPPSAPSFPDPGLPDGELAVALALGAGEVLRGLRADVDAAGGAFVAGELKDAGDAASQAWIAAALAHARPDDAVLSEEAADSAARLTADRVWIVDPLDGTREFAERVPPVEPVGTRVSTGSTSPAWRDDFAVHVALWERGSARSDGLVAGAVGLPARDAVLSTVTPGGARPVAGAEAVLDGRRRLRLAASRSRPPQFVQDLAARGHVELVPMGSAGVKVVSVVDGTVDAYVHAGGQYEWDSAAPVAVALAAGLDCTRLDGTPLEYNRQDPWLPDLFVCHPALAARLRAALTAVGVDIKEGAQP